MARRDNACLEEFRIAFGSVAATVVRNREAEALLAMASLNSIPGQLERLMDYYRSQIKPIDDQRSTGMYRHKVALGLLERFLTTLT